MTNPNQQISQLLSDRVASGDFPSAVYLVASGGREIFFDAIGKSVTGPSETNASIETIYDLASLTKPLVTTLLLAKRIERGLITLDTRASQFLPEFDHSDRRDKRDITVRHLATHTSGLSAWRPLYLISNGDPGQAAEAIALEPLQSTPGTHVLYSDLGFIALGVMLERMESTSLAVLARQEIFEPLKLKRTYFNPEAALQTEIAACEVGNAYEREMCRAEKSSGDYRGWRDQLIWGDVHDGNAHFLGGAAGHAGLFSTARETLKIANQFLAGRSELLSSATCELFRTDMTPGLEEARSFGWQLASTKDSTAGQSMSSDSFGHLGFTGTSCWVDPNAEQVFILLTNRTHSRPLPFANINSVRRQFHTLAVSALEGV
jgi:CubicO group peptidase (beta-lactamase class C family)